MTNVFIKFDRELFVSKNAFKRLKDDVRKGAEIKSNNYIKDGFELIVEKNDSDINVTAVSIQEKSKEDKRNELRKRLKMMSDRRSNANKDKINEIKRTVPKNLFKKYTNVINRYGFNIPSPDKIMNNPEKFKQQISMMASDFSKVSNDGQANASLKSYFKSLADLFDIEPMQMNLKKPDVVPNINKLMDENNNKLSNLDEDTEDEDEPPELILS